jgi:mono/diheme cytochrome c family protein
MADRLQAHHLLALLCLGACGVGGDGNDVPPLLADFRPGATIPGFVHSPPSGGAADVLALSRHEQGRWEVIFSRNLALPPASLQSLAHEGGPAAPPKDADLVPATGLLAAAVPLSISISDGGEADPLLREARYAGPLLLSADPSLQSAVFTTEIVLVDYGPSFAPVAAADFSDPRETRPSVLSGPGRDLRVKAGTDGGTKLHLLLAWADEGVTTGRAAWRWSGFAWHREGRSDEARVMIPLPLARPGFLAQGGCAASCHAPGMGPLALPVPSFAASSPSEECDLWIWRAENSLGVPVAEDARVTSDRSATPPFAAAAAAWAPDLGDRALIWNQDPAHALPLWMSETDPNASAPAVGFQVPGLPLAVAFRDVLANLPPAGGGAAVSYQAQVRPIFQARCTACHPPNGGLDLSTYAGVIAGGMSGPAVIPGNPDQSLLVRSITGIQQPQMPLGGPPLTTEQIDTIRAWIAEGALNN